MIAGILKEPKEENRVSLLPEQAETLTKKNVEVWMEEDAGINAFASNDAYRLKSVQVMQRNAILQQSDIIFTIHPLSSEDIAQLKPGAVLIGIYQPLFNFQIMNEWAVKGFTSFSLDTIPRTTRAQSMDVLSSQANIAGYRAVLLAATIFPRYFPMFMTAAGSIPPAKMLILGAGVAGLQAIATARRLGCVVEVFDTRPAVKEEVQSLGAKFIEVIGRVPSVLHTPLMSGANAIHGVVIIGAIIVMGKAGADNYLALTLGFLSVVLGTLNVVGGFVVTDRMLEMFKKKK